MTPPETAARAAMLANRVRKIARHRRKWARRAGVDCYRLYDRDIPELPLVIDWYAGHLHVAEFVRGEALPDLEALAAAAGEALGVPPEQVWCKHRERQPGSRQYTRVADREARVAVPEGGYRFWVNLSDYLDTGLFLDHRQTRAMVEAEARGKRVLNLFAYTGAFTVYAAGGGAASTTTVDLSSTYLDWAQENLRLNELAGPAHRGVQADVLEWLRGPHAERYDLVVLDPPTFSNSKRMRATLDLQRDQVALLTDTLALLSRGGVLYFSTNRRRFSLAGDALLGVDVEEITARTVPPDFERRRPHRCWRMVRR